MDTSTLNDSVAWDKDDLTVDQVEKTHKVQVNNVTGISPEDVIFLTAIRVTAGLSGAQLNTIRSSILAIGNVEEIQPVARLIAPAAEDLPENTDISVKITGKFQFSSSVE